MNSLQQTLILLYQHQHEYISGSYISEQLNISRQAVWKNINQIKQNGYIIESIKGKGYQIKHFKKGYEESLIHEFHKQHPFYEFIHFEDVVSSTQNIANELSYKYSNPFIVIANEQLEGRGRFNRRWDSSKNLGLWMSIVIYPKISLERIGPINLFISIAIIEVLRNEYDLQATIKWPNDIYIDDKKICGFITEGQFSQNELHHLTCGIGINLFQDSDQLSNQFERQITSLNNHVEDINQYEFLNHMLNYLTKYFEIMDSISFEDYKDKYISYSNIWGKEYNFLVGQHSFIGIPLDVTNQGELVIDHDGQHVTISSGDILSSK